MESLVVLVESLRYGGQDLKRGDVFTAPPIHGKPLRASRRAAFAVASDEPVKAEEVAPAVIEEPAPVVESVDSAAPVVGPEPVADESQAESEAVEVTEEAATPKRRGRPAKASQ